MDLSELPSLSIFKRTSIDKPIKKYKDMGFKGDKLELIEQGLSLDLDVDVYAKTEFSYEQMYEIFNKLVLGYDASTFTAKL